MSTAETTQSILAPGHIARAILFVSGLDQSLAVYRDILGMDELDSSADIPPEIAKEYGLLGRRGRMAWLGAGGSELGQLVLVEAEGLPPMPAARTDVMETGRSVLVFSSPSLFATAEALKQADVPRISDPVDNRINEGAKFGHFAEFVSFDPDGAVVTILQFLPVAGGPQIEEFAAPWLHERDDQISPVLRTSFIVADIERSLVFYRDLLGVSVIERREVIGSVGTLGLPPCSIKMAYLGPHETDQPRGLGTVALTEVFDPRPPTLSPREAPVVHAGQHAIVIALNDVDRAIERLERQNTPSMEGARASYFDVDANLVSLVEFA